MLLAILNTLAFYFLFDLLTKLAPEAGVYRTPSLMISVFEQLLFIGIYSGVISALSGSFGRQVNILQSATIFIWFNMLQLMATLAAIFVLVLTGPFGLLFLFAPIIWSVWAVGQYFAELVDNTSNMKGLILAAIALVIGTTVLALVISFLNLPTTEVITDV